MIKGGPIHHGQAVGKHPGRVLSAMQITGLFKCRYGSGDTGFYVGYVFIPSGFACYL